MTIVLHRHMRALGYCNRGGRQLCEQHGLSWEKFLNEGIDADTLRKLDNAMVERMIALAEAEEKNG